MSGGCRGAKGSPSTLLFLSSVHREQPEWPVPRTCNRPKVPLVEREDVQGIVTFGQNDVGGIREPDVYETRVTSHGLDGASYIASQEWFELVSTPGYFVQQSKFGIRPYPGNEQIIEFGQDER